MMLPQTQLTLMTTKAIQIIGIIFQNIKKTKTKKKTQNKTPPPPLKKTTKTSNIFCFNTTPLLVYEIVRI